MGKFQSKHVARREGPEGECILVNTQISSDKSSDGWPDIHLDNESEVSLSLHSQGPVGFAEDQVPLRVVLPPMTTSELSTHKVLSLDRNLLEKKVDSEVTTDNNNSKLNVEEIECGLSVTGSDKQEWAFTLYDFDGRGKVTKEDLGRLLKSLYDAVGSSISLSHTGGNKTLKLRLTVSPDNAKTDVLNNESAKTNKINKDKDNSKLSKESMKQNNLSQDEKFRKDVTMQDLSPKKDLKNHREMKNNNLAKTGDKPRLSSTEKRQLVELVQQNMERHRQREQQQLRRHNSDTHHHRPRKSRHHRHKKTSHDQVTCQESQERRNYYLDLAGIDSSLHHRNDLLNTTAPAAILPSCDYRNALQEVGSRTQDIGSRPLADLCSSKQRSRSHSARKDHSDRHRHRHRRSHSHDVATNVIDSTIKEDEPLISKDNTTGVDDNNKKETTHDTNGNIEKVESPKSPKSPRGGPKSPKSPKVRGAPKVTSTPKGQGTAGRLRPVSLPAHLPETISPHHHRRHRNRERNRKLAMQQVAAWIEREQVWMCDTEPVVLQNHQHHHHHEHHHHHHYHHYHEA